MKVLRLSDKDIEDVFMIYQKNNNLENLSKLYFIRDFNDIKLTTTMKNDIIKCEFIIFIIFINAHFSCYVFQKSENKLIFYDSMKRSNESSFKDSMMVYTKNIVQLILDCDCKISSIDFTEEYPKQEDGDSCGYFVLLFIIMFCIETRPSFYIKKNLTQNTVNQLYKVFLKHNKKLNFFL